MVPPLPYIAGPYTIPDPVVNIQLLAHCTGIVRLPGASTGADAEMAYADAHGIEVVDFTDLPLAARLAWQERA